MKVNIDQTIEVSDAQRVQMANVLDNKISKRQATRVEMKQFIWTAGSGWADQLEQQWGELFGEEEEEVDLEDLL